MNLFKNILNKKQPPIPAGRIRFASLAANRSRSIPALRNQALIRQSKLQIAPIQKRAFEAAKIGNTTNDWISTARSVNWDIRQGLPALRARARDLRFNDPYAKRFVELVKKNVVGPDGFIFRNKSFDWIKDGNNFKKLFDKIANQKIQDGFWDWNKKQYCSITEDVFFIELCQLIMATVAVDGEIFIKKIKDPNINKHGFTLQLIEADYVDERLTKKLPNGNFIDMGIEYTPYKKVVAYWIKVVGPEYEDYTGYMQSPYDYERIPKEQMIHLFVKETPSQRRGISWFVASAVRLKMLMGFEEASLVNARASAMKTAVIKPTEWAMGQKQITGDDIDVDGNIIQELEAGEIYKVPYGYDWVSHNPTYPHEQHKPFANISLHGAAAGLASVSYHELSGDFETINLSAGRLSFQDAREGWILLQGWFDNHFLMDIEPEWLSMALLTQAVSLPVEKFDKFNAPYFLGRRWGYINPEQDMNADIKGVQNYIDTFEKILADKGIDIDEHIEQLVDERQKFLDAGLTPPTDILLKKQYITTGKPDDSGNDNQDDNNPNDKSKKENSRTEIISLVNKSNGSVINAN